MKKIKLLRMYGEKGRYNSVLVGRNSRLDELQAAFLSIKMKYVDAWINRRREIAQMYTKLLSSVGDIEVPTDEYGAHSFHLYVIRTKKRDSLKEFLEKKQIGTGIHYPLAIHQAPSFSFLGYRPGDFPESEQSCKEILSLPMFPELTNVEVETVAGAIKEFFT